MNRWPLFVLINVMKQKPVLLYFSLILSILVIFVIFLIKLYVVNSDSFNLINNPFSTANTAKKCFVTGCSGTLCLENNSFNQDIVTTCEYKEEYACYKNARCEVQSNGNCGWTLDKELSNCVQSKKFYILSK